MRAPVAEGSVRGLRAGIGCTSWNCNGYFCVKIISNFDSFFFNLQRSMSPPKRAEDGVRPLERTAGWPGLFPWTAAIATPTAICDTTTWSSMYPPYSFYLFMAQVQGMQRNYSRRNTGIGRPQRTPRTFIHFLHSDYTFFYTCCPGRTHVSTQGRCTKDARGKAESSR